MKINRFKRLKDGMYQLVFEDNQELKIHEDLILKYDLLLTKTLDETDYDKIIQENKTYEVYNIALKYIKIKVRSMKEMEEYLLKKQFDFEQVENAINLLIKQGYLNNQSYARAFVNDRIHLSNDGPLKIKEELRKNQIDESIIDEMLISFDETLERDRIQKLIDKQVKINHHRSKIMLTKKIQTNLISLGYQPLLINELLSHIQIEDQHLFQKEYDKLYLKLSKKYQGKELEYKLKQKLYQKGFTKTND